VKNVADISLKGKILGFENIEEYVLEEVFASDSPFRLLRNTESGFSFLIVNPYSIASEYTFDVEDKTMKELELSPDNMDNVAVLCIVRQKNGSFFVNLRSPLVVNTERGLFSQVILPNEGYPVSAQFAIGQITS
jgi:flagellar assembly factor FliW